MMTRKDYRVIAAALKEARDQIEYTGSSLPRDRDQRRAGWASTVLATAAYLSTDGGFDRNGNRRFRRDLFLTAAGMPESEAIR